MTEVGIFIESLIDKVNNFRYVPQEMPLSQWPLPLLLSFGYLAGVFILQTYMKDRKAYTLVNFTILHNFIMTFGSLIMFIGMATSLFGIWQRHGAEALFCDHGSKEVGKGPLYFWIYVFYLSKYYEWADTALMCLKKNKLTFLHVYHHWVTMLLVWNCLENLIPIQWCAELLNCFVHIFMYYYYLLASLKKEIWWKKYITRLQIIQFVLVNSLHFVSIAWHYLWKGNCPSFDDTWGHQIGLGIINSYLLLFVQFYFSSYKSKKQQD